MKALIPGLLIAAALAGCSDDPELVETRSKLVGTWLEEFDQGSDGARRVLSLKADGKFTDEVSMPGSSPERRELAGEWSYDGLNLKRRYLEANGRQFSGGSMRFATFPLKAVTQSELVLDDNLQQRQARYRRIENGSGG